MNVSMRVFSETMYARLSARRVEMESPPVDRPDSLLFVDLNLSSAGDIPKAAAQLRRLSPTALGHIRHIVLRWPGLHQVHQSDLNSAFDVMADITRRSRMYTSAGFVLSSTGTAPTIAWGPSELGPNAVMSDDDSVLLRCREVELAALVSNGRALWTPKHYHYRLPSGRHSGSFVRLADAIRSVRDAEVMAWWLLEHANPALGIVTDTSTIVPIVLALQRMLSNAEFLLGEVCTLDSYPATVSEFTKSVRDASVGDASVLALLSVSSSGSTRDRLLAALQHMPEERWSLHTFVDKTEHAPCHLDDTLAGPYSRTSVWLATGDTAMVRPDTVADKCRLCKSKTHSRVVQIDPKSFDGLVLPDPELVTPDIKFTESVRDFWRYCDAADAIAFDVSPHASSSTYRPHRFSIGVRIDFDPLIERAIDASAAESQTSIQSQNSDGQRPTLVDSIETQVVELRKQSLGQFIDRVDLVLSLKGERGRAGGKGGNFIGMIAERILGDAPMIELDLNSEEHPEAIVDQIFNSQSICVVVLGIVTGTSVHRALAEIQSIRRSRGQLAVDVSVIAVHLRPATFRERQTIINSFGAASFLPIYESLLPFSESPFAAERDFLVGLSEVATVQSSAFYTQRIEFLTGGVVSSDERGLFWGLSAGKKTVMRPGSLFGEGLSPIPTVVSVGSAVQRNRYVRSSLDSVPEWRQFELPAIFRSYFDPLIICSVMRWLKPEECWWGREQDASRHIMSELLESYVGDEENRMMLAEFLLASALGKVPTAGTHVLIDRAEKYLEDHPAGDTDGALKFALAVVHEKDPELL